MGGSTVKRMFAAQALKTCGQAPETHVKKPGRTHTPIIQVSFLGPHKPKAPMLC